jgi:hypothetical protein
MQQKLGTHDFDRAAPLYLGGKIVTRSVGIFCWTETSRGNGVKRSAVKVRVRGLVEDWQRINQTAAGIVRMLDSGEYTGPKVVNI